MGKKKKKKKKIKNNGVYCPIILSKDKKKKGVLSPLEFNLLCNKIKINKSKIEIINF